MSRDVETPESRPFPWKCVRCGERTMMPEEVAYAAEIIHDGRPYQVSVPALRTPRCQNPNCRAILLDTYANRRITQALRRAAGLLEPEEIRHRREGLGLTQAALAERLEVGEATVSRWETGAQIQQRSLDKLLRLFFDLPEVRRTLEPPTIAQILDKGGKCGGQDVDLNRIAILWGAWAAIDGYRSDRNPRRPNVERPTDRELVEAADKGTLDGKLFERFCKEYEVFRNPLNVRDGRDERLQRIADTLANRYRGTAATTPNELAKVWWDAVEEVRGLLEEEFKRPPRMRSMCMKMLWFYRPKHGTMWDRYAVKGINLWRGLNLTTNIQTEGEAATFLQEFEALYHDIEPQINHVLATIAQLPGGMRYPYGRRVLDKALWFRGAEREEQEKQLKALVNVPERESWLRERLSEQAS